MEPLKCSVRFQFIKWTHYKSLFYNFQLHWYVKTDLTGKVGNFHAQKFIWKKSQTGQKLQACLEIFEWLVSYSVIIHCTLASANQTIWLAFQCNISSMFSLSVNYWSDQDRGGQAAKNNVSCNSIRGCFYFFLLGQSLTWLNLANLSPELTQEICPYMG